MYQVLSLPDLGHSGLGKEPQYPKTSRLLRIAPRTPSCHQEQELRLLPPSPILPFTLLVLASRSLPPGGLPAPQIRLGVPAVMFRWHPDLPYHLRLIALYHDYYVTSVSLAVLYTQ